MTAPYRNGLGEWHHQFVDTLLRRLLWYSPATRSTEGRQEELLDVLVATFALTRPALLGVLDILVVIRTASGTSFHKTVDGVPQELAINWSGLDQFETGGEFEEYAAFANDPVIGSRWVQNIEEALLMTLAHELAHFVVALTAIDDAPHGHAFQSAYRCIREHALNPLLDANAASAAQRAAARHEAKLLRKVQALQKMASDASSNPHEAERALRQLQSLLAKYGLETLPSESEHPHFIERAVPILRRGRYKPLNQYCFAIAQFCGVEAVIHTRREPQQLRAGRVQRTTHDYITYFGAVVDVEMATYLSELLHHEFEREERRFRQSTAYRQARGTGTHANTLLASFRAAFVKQLTARLLKSRSTIENSWLSEIPDHRALVISRDRQRQAAFAKRYPRLGTHRATVSSAPPINAAVAAGRSAAAAIHLGKPERLSQGKQLPLMK